MPEEPDVSPEEMEILDRLLAKRVEANKRQRAVELASISNRILEALRSRPEGMNWAELREMFDKNLSDKQIREALLTLKSTPLPRAKVEKNGDHSDERWVLSAAS